MTLPPSLALRSRAATDGERYEFVATAGGVRLDAWLAGWPELSAKGLSRSRIQALAAEGSVTVNGDPARPSRRIRRGDVVIVSVPPARSPADLIPQDISLSISYEDRHLVVVDKPAGLPVHPGPGHPDGTLVNGLLAHCPDIRGIGGELRPGIVHRLDRDTSGLLVVAKTQRAHRNLAEQMQRRAMLKEYLAVAVGTVTPESGAVDAPVARDPRRRQRMAVSAGGRDSRTDYETLAELPGHTLLKLRLETGRTHQIRVHLAWLGYPILGDEVYGKASALLRRQFLHAARLGFRHPISGDWSEHRAELPEDLEGVLRQLQSRSAL